MQGPQVSLRTPLHTPPQPGLTSGQPLLLDNNLTREIVHPEDVPPQPLPPRAPCGPPDPEQGCWGLDVRLAAPLLILAGAVILLLLYKLVQLKHRLRFAQAGDALHYGFYHASYTLKDPGLPRALPANGDARQVPDTPLGAPPPPTMEATPVTSPPPPLPPPPPRVLPSPPLLPPPAPPPAAAAATPPLVALRLPVIHTTPPSPQPSGGVGSDAEVYSRIGAFRPSRLSSLSQTQVVLFEHSAL